jgi:hypothetical protein
MNRKLDAAVRQPLCDTLRGSNITQFATDNSSGALAARERASGAFKHHMTISGESFFSPGHAQPALRDRWRQLNKKAQEHEQNKNVVRPDEPRPPGNELESSLEKPYKTASLVQDPHDDRGDDIAALRRGLRRLLDKVPLKHQPLNNKDREAPAKSGIYPPTPGDKSDPNTHKQKDLDPGFGIPSDYDLS